MPEFASALLLGLGFGFTTCSIACLPILAPYLLSFGQGFRDGAKSAFLFASGKTVAYAFLGAVAAFAAQAFPFLDAAAGRQVHGVVLVLTGVALPFISSDRCTGGTRRAATGMSLFVAGFSSSLTPCLPVAGLAASAAGAGSALRGAGLGLAFGLGIALSPVLAGGGVLALIGKTLRQEAHRSVPLVRGIAAGVLIVTGIRILS